MTDDNTPELTASEKLFKAASPWLGGSAFVICLYYLLERNQAIPWYVFGLCGILMGLGKAMVMAKDIWKP